MKAIKFLFAVLAITIFSSAVTAATGIHPALSFTGAALLSFIPAPEGASFYAGLNQEIWTDVLVRSFRRAEEASFLNEIPDESRYVLASRNENDIIHLVDVGADPQVYINNTTYPIPASAQTDGDIPIQLDKFQTEVTTVSDDEIQYIAYDKIALVQEKHSRAVIRERGKKAVHALAPAGDTADTPVLVTTGAADATGRKKLTYKDLIAFKRRIDDAGVDEDGRILVLCSDHYNDLLEDPNTKNVFAGQFQNESSGKLNQMLAGFKMYWYNLNPYFNPTTKTKLSYGAIPGATDYKASVFFLAKDMFRAEGRTKNYVKPPEPRTQQWEYNIRHNYIVLPRKNRAIGAIVSTQ